MTNEEIIQEYKRVLNDVHAKYKRNFWKTDIEQKTKVIVKYIIEQELKWTKKDIEQHCNSNLFYNFRILIPYRYYNNNAQYIINMCYNDNIKLKNFKNLGIYKKGMLCLL